jgi:Tol biopolymer transport system component
MLDARLGQVKPFLNNSRFWEVKPDLSPDGRWIAYSSNESGSEEVYVRPFPGRAMRYQVSSEGGNEPLWARNGKQLFYRRRDQVWAVDVETGGGFVSSKPHLLFEKSGYATAIPIRNWDLSLDGQRCP